MLNLPEDAEKIAASWRPEQGIRERARSLGWVGRPFTPQEWAFLSQGCDETATYLPARWQSPEVDRVAKLYVDALDEAETRVEMATIRHRNAVAAEVTRGQDIHAHRVQNGTRPLQQGEALIVGIPSGGETARALAALQDAISDRADLVAERDTAMLAQYAAESLAPAAPSVVREPVRLSRGRRS